jgi:hypothetical protein
VKRPLEVGDRVRVFSDSHCFGDESPDRARADLATVHEVDPKRGLKLEFAESDGGISAVWWHPKQCRRLLKKPRRRVWLYIPVLETLTSSERTMAVWKELPAEYVNDPNFVEFVEARRKR